MAEIHLARLAGEAGFEKTVVVKRLLPELVASKAFVAMFLDEGKLVARLDHPNVCEVHELGRDGAEYFLVMPYLDGVPAHDFIARPRDPDRIAQLRVAAGLITQACAGLHHAHELKGDNGPLLGLVHRDVSPSNLFVTTAGVVKVLDFGIAKVHGGAETEAGTIKGKTQYMAPEQLLGEQLDRRCDVFALGIVLFELATHSRLFKRSSDYLSARAILEEAIPRADAVDPAVPAALADVIAKALDRSPAKRYPDMRDLAKAVEAAMQPHGGVATADQIAAALAEWHGAELSAMRTRQARVIADARSRATVVTVPGKVAADPSRMLTTPRDVVRKRRLGVIVLAVLVIGGTGAVLAISMVREARRNSELAKVPDRVVVETPRPVDAAIAIAAADAAVTTSDGVDARTARSAPPIDFVDKTAEKNVDKTAEKNIDRPEIKRGTKPKVSKTDKHHAEAAKLADDRPGTFSIDVAPFGDIYVDGKYFAQTPVIAKPLPAGKHTIKAVRKDGSFRTYEVSIEPGKLTSKGIVSW